LMNIFKGNFFLMTALIEAHYFPSLEYFCALLPFENIILERHEYFVKQTCRNRCSVNTAQGQKLLTVPLMNRHGKILTGDVQVEQGNRWRNNHWRTLESAYRKAPYFEYYSDELKNILFRGHEFLFDLNENLLSFCLREAGIQKKISASVAYDQRVNENIIDLRCLISNKKPFTSRAFYYPTPYYQVFGNEFAPNLSFIDLLFCEGPGTPGLLRASLVSVNK
jgi:hypothetical protein